MLVLLRLFVYVSVCVCVCVCVRSSVCVVVYVMGCWFGRVLACIVVDDDDLSFGCLSGWLGVWLLVCLVLVGCMRVCVLG